MDWAMENSSRPIKLVSSSLQHAHSTVYLPYPVDNTTSQVENKGAMEKMHRSHTEHSIEAGIIEVLKEEKMDAKSAIADTMMLAMSTAIQAVPRRSSRRLSDFSDIAHLTVAFNGISLTPRQHKLIKTGYDRWRKKSEQSAGEWVLSYVAQRHSNLRLEFQRHPEIAQTHVAAISDILDMAVESVESLDDSLGPLLVSYASENGILEEKEGFDRNYWSRISEALCQLSRQFPVKTGKWETVGAWRIVILFIINKIDYGFQLDRKSLSKYPNSFDNQCYKL